MIVAMLLLMSTLTCAIFYKRCRQKPAQYVSTSACMAHPLHTNRPPPVETQISTDLPDDGDRCPSACDETHPHTMQTDCSATNSNTQSLDWSHLNPYSHLDYHWKVSMDVDNFHYSNYTRQDCDDRSCAYSQLYHSMSSLPSSHYASRASSLIPPIGVSKHLKGILSATGLPLACGQLFWHVEADRLGRFQFKEGLI